MWSVLKRFDYASVTGHELICSSLQKALTHGHTVSAYLFSGAEGIGKKTVAYAFAAALLCESPQKGVPCLACPSCRLLAAASHPDLITLSAPDDRKTIGVEQIREKLIKEAYVRPFSAARKVFVLEHGELLTQEAQNSLLKILEEPPEYAVFLILTTARTQLLETVCSRCLKLELLPLKETLCRSYFLAFPAKEPGRRELAASFAQGNIGRGKKMLEDDSYYALYKKTLRVLGATPGFASALAGLQRFLAENREQIEAVIDFMLVFLRDALRSSIRGKTKLICADEATAVAAFCADIPPVGLVHMMEAVIAYRKRLQKNASFTAAGLELLTRIQEEIHDKGNRNPIQIGR